VRMISLRLSLSQNLEVSVNANASMESAQDQISLKTYVKLNSRLSPDFSIQLYISLGEILSKRLSH